MANLTQQSKEQVQSIAARYPSKRSALLPALYVAQAQDGQVTSDAMADIADILELAPAEVEGVASFYSMYYHHKVGRFVFQVCGTLSCALCGAEDVIKFLENKLGVEAGHTTPDGLFMFEVVECLGACGTAPVMLFGDKYYERLTLDQLDSLIDALKANPDAAPTTAPQLVGYSLQVKG